MFPILANVCNAAAYDLSPVSLKAKAASERKRERTYVHSQYCMAGRHRVGHYIQIELANVQDHNLPPAYPFPAALPSTACTSTCMHVCVCVNPYSLAATLAEN